VCTAHPTRLLRALRVSVVKEIPIPGVPGFVVAFAGGVAVE
jgi:hypothetical protein